MRLNLATTTKQFDLLAGLEGGSLRTGWTGLLLVRTGSSSVQRVNKAVLDCALFTLVTLVTGDLDT